LIVNLLMIDMFTINPVTTLPAIQLHEHTGFLLRVAYDQARQRKMQSMPEGAAPREYSLLQALLATGPISQQQLAEQMRVNRTLIVGIVDRHERRGWVERRRDPDDRRSYRLHVTPAGEAAVAQMAPLVAAGSAAMAARLTEDERGRLNVLLRDLIASEQRLIPPALADLTGFLVVQAHFLTRDFANEAFRDLPIDIHHYGVLTALDELGPASQQALTSVMLISATRVMQIVDELERLGLVERRRNPTDRRAYTVTMTAAGRKVLADGGEIAKALPIRHDDELRPLLRKLVGL
jgi:DNA-binding MarR family transcriptional regulator